jgi:hypothetical protein
LILKNHHIHILYLSYVMLKNMISLFNQNKCLYALFPFGYGFARSINGTNDPPFNVIGNRIGFAILNGSMYAVPPYTVIYVVKLMNRIDIKLTGKDPQKYEDSYKDLFGNNQNVFF